MLEEYIIIGGGEHSKMIENVIDLLNLNLLGIIDPVKSQYFNWLGTDLEIEKISNKYSYAKFIIGVGSILLRNKIIHKTKFLSLKFTVLKHPSAIIAADPIIEKGTFIGAGVIIQPGVTIANHCIINSGSIIEHDSEIGGNTHIAPGVVMGGGCNIGSNCMIGLGARVKDHIKIGNNVTVGAGAVVINNIEDNSIVVGIPARGI
jgi:sugar O-acyltransferase (sialic acid O-acetyltransferase NeuD family)